MNTPTPATCPKPLLADHRAGLIADIQDTPPETTQWFARVKALGQVSVPYRNEAAGCGRCAACHLLKQ